MDGSEMKTLTLAKEGEKYVFKFDRPRQQALLGVFGRFAANPDLNFSWHDAAVLSRKIREKEQTQQSPGPQIGARPEPGT
jgi:hypothetical protein